MVSILNEALIIVIHDSCALQCSKYRRVTLIQALGAIPWVSQLGLYMVNAYTTSIALSFDYE